MLKDDLINEEIATSDESIEDTNNKKIKMLIGMLKIPLSMEYAKRYFKN